MVGAAEDGRSLVWVLFSLLVLLLTLQNRGVVQGRLGSCESDVLDGHTQTQLVLTGSTEL